MIPTARRVRRAKFQDKSHARTFRSGARARARTAVGVILLAWTFRFRFLLDATETVFAGEKADRPATLPARSTPNCRLTTFRYNPESAPPTRQPSPTRSGVKGKSFGPSPDNSDSGSMSDGVKIERAYSPKSSDREGTFWQSRGTMRTIRRS